MYNLKVFPLRDYFWKVNNKDFAVTHGDINCVDFEQNPRQK